MRFGIDVAQQRLEWEEIVRRVRVGEELGFDGAWGFDHFQPMYGEGPGNCFEGMTTLAALAGLTTRIRLGLLVTGVTYRHPSVLATELLTVDHASTGRVEAALGSAWFDGEHTALGIEFPSTAERFDLLEDTLEIMTRLWTGERVSYDGRRVSLHEAQVLPLPVQRPHPPIWIGGMGPKRTIPLVARFADMWHTYGSPDDVREAGARVEELARAAGRDPASIGRAGSLSISEPIDGVLKAVDEYEAAGIDYLVCGWPAEGAAKVEAFASRALAGRPAG